MDLRKLNRLKQMVSWQFHVLQIGAWVVKIPKSKAQVRAAITSRKWGQELPSERLIALSNEVAGDARRSLEVLRSRPKVADLCGQPRFLSSRVIVQDRGTTFLDLVLEKETTTEDAVQRYFTLCMQLWNHGLFEFTFDFLRNVGLDKHGDAFFIDIGGFIDDDARASDYLERRYWQDRHDYLSLGSASRSLFDNLADDLFCSKNLALQWNVVKS